MSDCWGNVSPKRLMETIVILWTLSEVPGASRGQRAKFTLSDTGRTRQLSFEREKGLVEILAFLSGTSDDPSKVVATCVEEGLAGNSLTIRFATNSGDGSDVLSGLGRIAKILEKASTRGRTREVDSYDLLQEIVRMDFWRILSRLRSIHANKSRKTIGKPVLMKQLSEAVNRDLRKICPKLSAESLLALRKKVEILHNLSSALEALSTVNVELGEVRTVLMQILECASEIANEETLPVVLEAARDLDPGVKFHLVSAIGKLGRYHTAGQDLIHAARTTRYSIFNKVLIKRYQTQPTQKPGYKKNPPTLESSVNELMMGESTLKDHLSAFSVQNYLGELYPRRSEAFACHTSSISASWKIHAEIKLLFFYEVHRVDLPPRVICASKSPCYLCHLFLELYGGYHVPDTHGRLYPGWTLPTRVENISDERRKAIGRIIDALHNALVLRIQQLVLQKRISVRPPNESVIWATANWSASTMPLQLRASTSKVSITSQQTSEWRNDPLGSTDTYEVATKHQGSPTLSQDDLLQAPADAGELPYQGSASQVDSSATSHCFLRTGDAVGICLGDEEQEITIRTKNIKLTISREISGNGDTPQVYWAHCKLIDKYELRRFISDIEPVDVMSVLPGSEIVLNEGSLNASADLSLAACDQVLSIKYSSSASGGLVDNSKSSM